MRKIDAIEKDLEENFEELVDYLMYEAPKRHTMTEAFNRALTPLEEKIKEMKRNYLFTRLRIK
jgi:cellulase/cellobiase CelA1